MPRYEIEPGRRHRGPGARISLIVILVLVLFGARSASSYAIEIAWWKELGQLSTWWSMLYYNLAPIAAATLLAFAVLWTTHARALKFAGTSVGEHRIYTRIATAGLLLLGYFIAAASIDTWTVVRFAGSRGLPAAATAWHDVIFNRPLSFYLFDLPFYLLLRSYLLALVIVCILVYWLAARAWQLRYKFPQLAEIRELDPTFFRLEGGLESRFLRGAATVLLLAVALRYYLGRYEMVYNEHGTFLVGIDYVDQNIGLPLQWLVIAACLAAAVFVWMGRWFLAGTMALALVVNFALPAAVAALYVRPNEISLQRPYIQSHIHATRSAFGLEQRVREIEFKARPEAPIDVAHHKPLLDNVRLWDAHAFHDTVTQIQALRPYYVFHERPDVDRYTIDGQLRQVLLSPRELDLTQLPAARANWINPAFIYTHGYGLVLAPVSQITPDGLPVLLIDNAPPVVKTGSLKLTRPELYYGEVTHEPVFVHTVQEEFNYPSGENNVTSRYEGTGGFPITSFAMRLAAAIREGEPNILLTNYLKDNSRMMIHRKIQDRLQELAGFLEWDQDPYLVITDAGRMVWMIDGYTKKVATIVIAGRATGIGVVNHETLVAAFGDMLDHKSARREQDRRAARDADGIKMRPVIQIRHEYQAIAGGPMQVGFTRDIGKRTGKRVWAFPHGMPGSVTRRGYPDRPGFRHLRQNWPRRPAVTGASRIRDSRAIGRPNRRLILVGGGREIQQRCAL